MNDDWVKKFITYDAWNGGYIAWDETQVNILGGFWYYHEAKEAVLQYAKTLNKKTAEPRVTKGMPFTINVGPNEKMTLNKKESKMDFQVGDRVVCLLNGEGVIVRKKDNDDIYVLAADFDDGAKESYTNDGYLYEGNKYPCLFHEGTEINIKPAEPKRYPWVNVYVANDGRCDTGIQYPTKEQAIDNNEINHNWKYVDTIQLKPKAEEKDMK